MNLEDTGYAIDYARRTPYRKVFAPYVGKYPHTLSDENFAMATHVSSTQLTTNGNIANGLPDAVKTHFNDLQEMKTERGPFFTRFVFLAKFPAIDCLLIGVGTDEMYYVVVTVDDAGYDLWKPPFDLHRRPVLVDEEMKTVICLSHHQEVTVKLIPFGGGHVALCPKCDKLAYFD